MPAEIKFSNLGIPYLVEFANISIRSPASVFKKNAKKAAKKRLPPPPVRCPTCGHLPTPPPPALDDVEADVGCGTRPGGLYISFASTQARGLPPTKLSDRRLAKLRWAIAEAVTQAGMTTPASEEVVNPMDAASVDGSETVQSSVSSTTKQSLFKGTYGQVKEALRKAGLSTSPCAETGFENGKWSCFIDFFVAALILVIV